MPLNILNWVLALSPVIVVLILMLVFKWGGSKAGAAGWFASLLVAFAVFGAGPLVLAYSQTQAVFLSLDVLYIVWTALLLFHIADEAGAVRVIGSALPKLTADRMMQGLLLGWLFASFLQGMGGFGVPVAVTAPLLVGLGFSPVQAVIMACLGHGWAVNFGSLATSFQTLMAVTGIPGEVLAPDAAMLLGISAFACGLLVAFVSAGWKGMLRSLPAVLVLTVVMGGVQYLLATNGIWTLGATGGASAGLLTGIVLSRLPLYQTRRDECCADMPAAGSLPEPAAGENGHRSLPVALSAYVLLVVLAFAANLIPPLQSWLESVSVSLPFPELVTSFGFITPAGEGRTIQIFSHPGAILFYTAVLAYGIYKVAGYFSPGAEKRILDKTLRGSVNSSLGIVALVAMAVVMSNSGMTNLLAEGLSQSFGRTFYPLVAPFIGALGSFITGSNNNANVLFGLLQMRTAELLDLSVPLILAAQTAGGSLGSVLAPAKVIVGCSTVGLGDNESVVMGKILKYGVLPILFVALLTLLFAQ